MKKMMMITIIAMLVMAICTLTGCGQDEPDAFKVTVRDNGVVYENYIYEDIIYENVIDYEDVMIVW